MKPTPSKPASSGKKQPRRKDAATRKDTFPVVAIGASAGGLEAYKEFFVGLPSDTGMAFVLVQHLDPSHGSMLTEIIAKATRMPVEEVRSGVAIQPNRVYVIPPNALMALADGAFRLSPRGRVPGQHLAVNFFMRSLAQEQKSSAIGIVLSGTGADGTSGMEDIKAEGGITFAQDPATAKYDGMPRSAIDTGCADFVLAPKDIARELRRIQRHPYVQAEKRDESEEQGAEEAGAEERDTEPAIDAAPSSHAKDFGAVLGQLRKSSGVDFSQYKPNTIHRRALRRMLLLKVDSLRDYGNYLKEHPEEGEKLFDDVLIPVTSFFRDFEAFEALKTQVYPAIVKDKVNKGVIRMWAPGCSTGEETYSLAMTLLEFLGERASSFQVQIFGTDLNEKGIQKARAGIYRESIAEEISPERMARFFVKVEEGYRVNKAVRDMCVFARQNLANDPPFSQMNVVACRNLLIYIQPVLQKKIIPILHYALKPSGFLVLGSSESVAAFPELFSTVDKKHKIYAKKAITSRLHYDFVQSHYPAQSTLSVPGTTLKSLSADKDEVDVQAEADRVVLREYAPVGVVINREMEVVQFRGQTTPYLALPPGRPSVNVLKLARNGLAIELRALIAAATKKGGTARKDGVPFDDNGQKRMLNLSVTPLGNKRSTENGARDRHFSLILFDDVTPQWTSAAEAASRRKTKSRGPNDEETRRLKQELAGTRDALHSAIESEDSLKEEFQSANEEILSANEELQSTNEELETSKEELQSANEELSTLNAELRNKNSELHDLSNDILNLLNSTRIPVVMLDRRLCIRRITPAATKLFKVLPADIGRPFADIKLNIKESDITSHDLELQIVNVLDSLQPIEREVRDLEGRWHGLSVLPYRTQENKIDGIVLALQDIDAAKSASEQLARSTTFFRGITDTVREPLLVLDQELRVVAANKSFLSTFEVTLEQTINRLLYDLGNGQWNIPALRRLLERVLPEEQSVTDFAVDHAFETIGHKKMLLNARRLAQPDQSQPMILLAIEDITQRSQAEAKLRESEERYRTLFEGIDEGFCIIEKVEGGTDGQLDFRYIAANPAFEAQSGVRNVVGKTIRQVVPGESEEWFETYDSIVKTGKPIRFERRLDTQGRVLDLYACRIESEGHHRVAVVFNDITARKRAELTRARLAAIVECSDDAIIGKDLNGIIETWNSGAERLFGYTEEEAIGKPVTMLMPPDRIHEEPGILARIRRREHIEHYESVRRRKDGRLLDVSLTISPIVDVHGQVVGASKIARDITERKQVEEELRLSEERFRMVADNMSQLAWTCDQLGNVTWYNQRWLDYTGMSFKEMEGWNWSKVQHPDHLDRVVQGVKRSRDTGEIWEDTFPLRGKDGTYRWFLSRAIPIVDAGGKVVRWFGTNTDITESKLSEAALIKSEKLAAAGRLAATLAHEINNPLQAVANLVSLWRQSPGLDTQGQEYATLAEDELRRVTHLTQQSLTFYRESAHPAAVDLEEIIDNVLTIYYKRIEAKSIRVTKQYLAHGTTIKTYPGEIRQVFSTLLLNAMEAVDTDGTIAVRVHKSFHWKNPAIRGVRITICDNGVGIAPHNIARVFEPFFTTKGENGTGLGLWVANGIVDRLGGSILMRSRVHPGRRGTFFSVFLPSQLPNGNQHNDLLVPTHGR